MQLCSSLSILWHCLSLGLEWKLTFCSPVATAEFSKFANFPGGSDGKVSAYNAGDLGSIPGWGRYPRGGDGNPLQYSCLENPKDRGAWQATGQSVTKNRTQLSNWICMYGRILSLDTFSTTDCQHPLDHGKSKRVPEKYLFLLYWLCQSLWLCGSQSTVENSERDGDTRPPDLPLEKPVCRSGSNS